MNRPTARILLVEDNPADVLLVREALKFYESASLHVCRDGVEALDYLRQRTEEGEAGLPDLVLLDLNMPRMSGHELLAEVKADHALSRIPIVVLSTSTAETDIRTTYDLHANSYVAKPVDLELFIEAVRDIARYWLGVSQPC